MMLAAIFPGRSGYARRFRAGFAGSQTGALRAVPACRIAGAVDHHAGGDDWLAGCG
jgi:hypothetical protein